MNQVPNQRLSILLLAMLAMINVNTLPAQSTASASLAGSVTDSTSAVIVAATVTLENRQSNILKTARTDSRGNFQFTGLSAGSYSVQVRASGFTASTATVHYQGSSLTLNFALFPSGGIAQVEVSSENSDPTEMAQVDVAPREISQLPLESLSSPFSSLVTSTTPGVAADSNGSFHPLGDHAEASFVVDGQPITDQQSRTFSSQVSLNALQSVVVREGSPTADVGDKTSMVIVAQTESGLEKTTPHGRVSLSRGAYSTSATSANIGYGTHRFGTFSALDALNSGRFLDTPETVALHANGNAQNIFERLDWKASEQTSYQLNGSLSSSWFQSPNTFDQESLGQNQRQTIVSFNVAPQVMHTFNSHAVLQTNFWVRQDKVRYRPSSDLFADTPATLEQARRLTSVGGRSELTLSHGRHNAIVGLEIKRTLLAEQFATGITDPAYNSPCLNSDGSPSADTSLTEPSQCAGAGLTVNTGFLPGLASIDLTRTGSKYAFQGRADIRQEAIYGEDAIHMADFIAQVGIRQDFYDGLSRSKGTQPRLGLVYTASSLHTNFHVNYARVFLTPYNENLIVASSNGPGSISSALGANDSAVLKTGHRNQFNTGFATNMHRVSVTGEYFWKFSYGAYDFDVLLNSPLTFPTQFRKSKIDGALVRATLKPVHGLQGYFTVSHVRSRLFGPEVGGISFSAPYSGVARPDHDEGLAMNVNLNYQFGRRGPWVNGAYRYDGGLVAVAVPTMATALALTGDEQQQMGLHCGPQFAAPGLPLRACNGTLGATRIRIPRAGTENDDKNPPRIAVRNTVDLAVGEDNLMRRDGQSLGVRAEVVNLTNASALYNFLSTFSGTHFLTGRAITVGLQYQF